MLPEYKWAKDPVTKYHLFQFSRTNCPSSPPGMSSQPSMIRVPYSGILSQPSANNESAQEEDKQKPKFSSNLIERVLHQCWNVYLTRRKFPHLRKMDKKMVHYLHCRKSRQSFYAPDHSTLLLVKCGTEETLLK